MDCELFIKIMIICMLSVEYLPHSTVEYRTTRFPRPFLPSFQDGPTDRPTDMLEIVGYGNLAREHYFSSLPPFLLEREEE